MRSPARRPKARAEMGYLSDPALLFGLGIACLAGLVVTAGWYRTTSRLRDATYLTIYAAGAVLFLVLSSESAGRTAFLPRDWLAGAVTAAQSLILAALVVVSVDLWFNFDDFAHQPGMKGRGRILMLLMTPLSGVAMFWVGVMLWQSFGPAIYEMRGNLVYFVEQDAAAPETYAFLLAADQTLKALLLDFPEVYRIGLVAATNYSANIAFSTFCLVYRLFLTACLLAVAIRIWRNA